MKNKIINHIYQKLSKNMILKRVNLIIYEMEKQQYMKEMEAY